MFSEVVSRGLSNATSALGEHPFRGRERLADAMARLAGRLCNDRGVSFPCRGVRFETDLSDRVQRQMWAGAYETHLRDCFRVLLKPGDTYADIGAHIGFHAVSAAFSVGAAGRVWAFEADPEMYKRLVRNLSQFRWANALNNAIWEKTGTFTFERSASRHESGWGTLTAVRDLGQGEHLNVNAVSLDEWRERFQINRLDSIKIDAEGSELAILRGARATLDRFRPIIVLEMNGVLLEQAGTSPEAIARHLTGLQYRLYRLGWRRLERWTSAKHRAFSETLSLPAEHADASLLRLERAAFHRSD